MITLAAQWYAHLVLGGTFGLGIWIYYAWKIKYDEAVRKHREEQDDV